MTEIYLRIADRVLTPLIVVLAISLFLRGHDYPGGGFIAGLTFAAAIELTILARGAAPVQRHLGRYLLPLAGFGLLLAVTAPFLGIYAGGFFKSIWGKVDFFGVTIKVGTPQLFDLGVMLVVIGMSLTYLLNLSERGKEQESAVTAGSGEQGGQS